MSGDDYKIMSEGQNPMRAGNGPQPPQVVMYAVQQPNGTVAYVPHSAVEFPQNTVILAPTAVDAAPKNELNQFLKNMFGAYAVLLFIEGILASVLTHFGAPVGVGVAIPCFLGMIIAFINLGCCGTGFVNFFCSNITQFIFAVFSIACASAAFSQNFTLEACAVENGDSPNYTTYGHASFFQEAIDCSSGYVYADRSCGCVNHAGDCLHFATHYTDCDSILDDAPGLSLAIFLLALAQMLMLFGMFFYLVVIVDRSKL
jgi:hypothetical protein